MLIVEHTHSLMKTIKRLSVRCGWLTQLPLYVQVHCGLVVVDVDAKRSNRCAIAQMMSRHLWEAVKRYVSKRANERCVSNM